MGVSAEGVRVRHGPAQLQQGTGQQSVISVLWEAAGALTSHQGNIFRETSSSLKPVKEAELGQLRLQGKHSRWMKL